MSSEGIGSAGIARQFGIKSFGCVVAGLLLLATANNLPAQAAADVTTAELKRLSVEELMALEVTSVSKRPERLAEAAAAIQVITNEDIRESGAVTLPETLRLADNLQVGQKNAHDWAVSARGFNTELANKLLVLVDGRSVYTPLYSGVFWDAQDYVLDDLDRIEVISGPGGTLWGANAVNGVINIISKSAEETQGLYLQGGGGSRFREFGSARYGGTIAPDTYFRVYAKYVDAEAQSLASGASNTDSWHQMRSGFRVDALRSAGNQLTLQGDLYDGSTQAALGLSELRGANMLGRWAHSFSPDSDMSLQAYFDHTRFATHVAAIAFAPAGVFEDNLDTYDLDFQHHFRLNARHRLIWGLAYRRTHDVVDNAPSVAFFPSVLDQDLYSGFVQDEILVRDDLYLAVGTKLEHNDYTGFEVEPDVRMRWTVRANQLLWAAVSRAVRTPSRIDHDVALPAPSTGLTILAGGQDFESESVTAYQLGYRGQVGPRLSASVSTFYNRYDDIRSTSPSDNPTFPGLPFPFVFRNDVEGDTYGVELASDYQPIDRLRLHAGYTFLREHLRVKAGKVDINAARNETADPEQQLSVRSTIDLSSRIELNASLRWVDTLHLNRGPVIGTVPSYIDLDLRLGWRFTPGLELSVVGLNLLHDRHPEYGFPSPSRVEIERSVFGWLAWRY